MCSCKQGSLNDLNSQIKVARDELNNLRTCVNSLKRVNVKDREKILCFIGEKKTITTERQNCPPSESMSRWSQASWTLPTRAIGFIKSAFLDKNGTPRQPTVAKTKATLKIDRSLFNNPDHALEGLEKFSHVWLIFCFHQNGTRDGPFSKAKVRPPRLGGQAVGVFACRSPHRPNPIGLTLAKIETVRPGGILELGSVDLIDGTPILDLKPFIPAYDSPGCWDGESSGDQVEDREDKSVKTAEWLKAADERSSKWRTFFTPTAEAAFEVLVEAKRTSGVDERVDPEELKAVVREIMAADPRSVYRKAKCQDSLYFCRVAGVHVTAWFDDDNRVVNVLRIKEAKSKDSDTT